MAAGKSSKGSIRSLFSITSATLVAALLTAAFLPHSVAAAAAAPAVTVRVGYPQPSGAQLPLWVMSEAKLDKNTASIYKTFISPAARD